MRTVADRRSAPDDGAPAATETVIEPPLAARLVFEPPTTAGEPETLSESVATAAPGKSGSGSASLTSSSSAVPSRGSTQRSWKQPKTARQFGGQVNRVGTLLLNGQIDLDVARVYSALARTVAQSMTAQVAQARFLRTQPDLTLEDIDEEQDADA